MSTIKGEERRKDVQKILESGCINELQEWLTSSAITDEERSIMERVHPRFMGGEYLPDLKPGEVEIARIVMQSTLQDVISFRAQLTDKSIRYSIVADYDHEAHFDCEPQESTEPLTMGEMISMIDHMGFIDEHRYFHVEDGNDPEDMVDFFSVFSAFYPELSAYFEKEALEWVEEKWFESFLGDMAGACSTEELVDYCEECGMDLKLAYAKLSKNYEPVTEDFLYELRKRYPDEFSGLEPKMSKPLVGQLELPFGNEARS
jgi:hypothetical protein